MGETPITILATWAMLSGGALVIENACFFFYLKRVGANPSYFLSGTPPHLNSCYKKWCQISGVNPGPRLKLRKWLGINFFISFPICFLLIIYFGENMKANL